MDVFITPEARREIEALRALRLRPGAWGILVGHKRGFRFIVEKLFPAPIGVSRPDEKLVAGLDGVWPGRTMGLFAFRPDAAFKKTVLGPAWYGKLVLQMTGPAKAPVLRPAVVEFRRKFILVPAPFAPAGRDKAHE